MKFKELRPLFKTRLNGFYSDSEISAIYRFYCEDILGKEVNSAVDNEDVKAGVDIEAHLKELTEGKPLQYITGVQWFLDIPFKVNEHVLIPRPETEELVEWVVEENSSSKCRIIDIGTGSGCIAVALAKMLPDAEVWASDVSEKALETAALNAQNAGVSVRFVKDDILKSEISNTEKFDIMVSNPPYIPSNEADNLETNVIDYEPHLALFVPENDPLIFYKAISEFSKTHLTEAGLCYFEIHKDFSNDLYSYFKSRHHDDIKIRNDMSGNVRMIKIRSS